MLNIPNEIFGQHDTFVGWLFLLLVHSLFLTYLEAVMNMFRIVNFLFVITDNHLNP